MNIYSQISSNKMKTWLIIILFVAFITTIVFVYGKVSGSGLSYAGVALIISGIMGFVSYYYSDKMILGMSSAKQIQKKDDPEHAVVCVTTGILEKLNKAELEGVIAHELSHIRNYDIRLMSIVVILVGLVALLADFFII